MYIVLRDAMPSLVDSSIFMQAILCLPLLRKGSDEKAQTRYNHVLPDVTISCFVFSCKVFGVLH